MSRILLELDLTVPPVEAPPTDPLGAIAARRRPLLRDITDGLRLGAEDPNVVGLIAKVGANGPSLAQAQEIAESVRRFAAAGKQTLAWTETFGEFGPATVSYLLAASFAEIWLQPSGDLGLTGVVAEAMFVKEALGKLGVVPEVSARKEYKTAPNTYLEPGMTEAHREAAERLTTSVMEQVVRAVSRTRRLDQQVIHQAVDDAPLSAPQAVELGLVDRLGYRDEVYGEMMRRLGDPQLRFVHRYRRSARYGARDALSFFAHRPTVGVVHAAGAIHLGRSTRRGPAGTTVGSDTLTAALRAARKDPQVRSVVLRVDSPGGSYIASDTIRREVIRTQDAGKPVVASMGGVAASGGYFVSMAADALVALPGTLTGSIGVFGGKAVVRDLFERLGIAHEAVSQGKNARMFSGNVPFTDAQWERVEAWLDRVYTDFTQKVATDRHLDLVEVEPVAKGRVWTGADAREHGLVDQLGGLESAVVIAAERAGLARDEVQVHPVPRTGLVERLRTPDSSEEAPAAQTFALGELAERPLAWLADMIGVPATGVLTPPVLWRLR